MIVDVAVSAPPARRSSRLARIGAIARRDLAIELSYRLQFIMRLFGTLMLSLTLFYGSKLVQNPAQLRQYGDNYFAFVLVGMVVTSFVSLGIGAFSRNVSEQQRGGTLEVLLAAPTDLWVLMAGSFVVPLGLTLMQMVVFVLAGAVGGVHIHALGTLLAVVMLVLLVIAFAAFGIFSAGLIILVQRGDPITLLISQGTTFLAGTVFPVALLPLPARVLAHAVPAYYALDGMRRTMLAGAGLSTAGGDLLALVIFAAVLVPASLAFLSWAVQVARRAGTLGTY
jgi:ABC-2 type transport system permease protein